MTGGSECRPRASPGAEDVPRFGAKPLGARGRWDTTCPLVSHWSVTLKGTGQHLAKGMAVPSDLRRKLHFRDSWIIQQTPKDLLCAPKTLSGATETQQPPCEVLARVCMSVSGSELTSGLGRGRLRSCLILSLERACVLEGIAPMKKKSYKLGFYISSSSSV